MTSVLVAARPTRSPNPMFPKQCFPNQRSLPRGFLVNNGQMSRSYIAVLFTLLLALTASCSSGDNISDELSGREFWSTGVTEAGDERPLVGDTRLTLRFDDDQLGANAGCNTMGGTFSIDGDQLRTNDLSMTEMGCDSERHAQDQFVVDVLASQPTITLNGDNLQLQTETVTIDLLDATVANPARPLAGTTWEVDGFLSGATASSFATSTRASFVIDGDSTMQLFDGCATVSIAVEVDDTELRFDPQAMPDVSDCDAPPGYRQSVYATMSRGALNYSITGTNLSLTTPDNVGLTLRAVG